MKSDTEIIIEASALIASQLARSASDGGGSSKPLLDIDQNRCELIADSAVRLAKQLVVSLRKQRVISN